MLLSEKRRTFARKTTNHQTMIDFRERVKDLCKEKGITQKDLAESMGMSYVQLNASLRGVDPKDKTTKTYPSIKTLIRIAEHLGIEVEDIFATGEVISRHLPKQEAGGDSFRCPNCGTEFRLAKSPSCMTNEEIKTEIERLKALIEEAPLPKLTDEDFEKARKLNDQIP